MTGQKLKCFFVSFFRHRIFLLVGNFNFQSQLNLLEYYFEHFCAPMKVIEPTRWLSMVTCWLGKLKSNQNENIKNGSNNEMLSERNQRDREREKKRKSYFALCQCITQINNCFVFQNTYIQITLCAWFYFRVFAYFIYSFFSVRPDCVSIFGDLNHKKILFSNLWYFSASFLLLCSISLTMSVKMSIKETTGWHWLFFFQIIRLKFPNKLFTRETFRVNYSYFTPHSQANIDLTRFILWLSYLLLLLLYEIHCHIINDKLTFVS